MVQGSLLLSRISAPLRRSGRVCHAPRRGIRHRVVSSEVVEDLADREFFVAGGQARIAFVLLRDRDAGYAVLALAGEDGAGVRGLRRTSDIA
jgi:hypothetical protein